MGRRIGRILSWALGLSLTLTGCYFRDANELYVIPQPPKDYEALQARLSEVLASGGEYAAPLSGELIQSVQLQDLDGDGNQEAIAFFRFYTDEKPLKIYIFKQNSQVYETMDVIEGAGTAINSVEYVQLNDDTARELVVSWQMSDTARSLAAYSIATGQADEILRTDYDSYRLADLDQDGQQELAVFRTPASDPESTSLQLPQAQLYDSSSGIFELAGRAPLSKNITSVASGGVRSGYLMGRVPALFVVSNYGEAGGATVTDIFTYQNGQLNNISLIPDDPADDPNLGESKETIRYYTQITGCDINGDGIMELPEPVPLVDAVQSGGTGNFWLLHWRQFDAQGRPYPVFTTYHNDRDGWYFILPDPWGDSVMLSRSDLPGGGERAVTISYRERGEEPIPMLTIYKLTGASRVRRASLAGRFILFPEEGQEEMDEANTIYAARFEKGWDNSLTESEVRQRFEIIKTDWSGGN